MANMQDGGYDSEDFKVDHDFENEASKVEVGDNFTIITNEPKNGDPFFVILCDKTLHRCEATFKDGWGNMWYEGDMIIGVCVVSKNGNPKRPNHFICVFEELFTSCLCLFSFGVKFKKFHAPKCHL
jgi:hypothetical protein